MNKTKSCRKRIEPQKKKIKYFGKNILRVNSNIRKNERISNNSIDRFHQTPFQLFLLQYDMW